ncbi:MAG: hypothetical protein ACI9MR_002495 [Myxococcota bacterium]|jgi:hypothetical protein
MKVWTRMLASTVALGAAGLQLAGCSDSGNGGVGGGSGPSCQLVGEPIALDYSRHFDVAAAGAGFVVAISDANGAASYLVETDTIGARQDLPLGGSGALALNANAAGTKVFGISGGIGFGSNGVRVATWEAGAWTTVSSEPLNPVALSPKGISMAENGDGDLVITFADGISTLRYRELLFDGTIFGAETEILSGDSGIDGTEVHTAALPDGTVVMTTLGRDQGESTIFQTTRQIDGGWGNPTVVGPAPDSLGNTIVTALAADNTGAAWVVEARSTSFLDDTDGQVTFYRLDDGLRTVAKVGDDRLFVQGVSAASLGDGRLVAAASWGANNLEAAQSNDSVELYACSAAGACGKAVTLDGRNGTFYEQTALATRGENGVAVWAWETKGSDADTSGVTIQRFRCPAPAVSAE